jgi:UrcA family protein
MLTRSKMPAVVAILTGMAALAPFQPAAAQDRPVFVYGEQESTRTEHVRFADIDLATSSGARKLQARVGGAIKRVCLFEPEIRLQPSDYQACATDSLAKAEPQVARAIARAQALALNGQPAAISATILVSAQ